ncbi:hypothetical protein OH77DRAFT_1517749 [Trametes cingulata]|nr:hypothetical protein OH77DRAFT_1523731 [Trametes cingulata]KAI0359191.1 hypothetical protein OH77DRAFT_1517749 [Trametes cingulata]
MERTSASARALLCPEILVEIFDYLTPGRPLDENALPRERIRRREAQQTLARAARAAPSVLSLPLAQHRSTEPWAPSRDCLARPASSRDPPLALAVLALLALVFEICIAPR